MKCSTILFTLLISAFGFADVATRPSMDFIKVSPDGRHFLHASDGGRFTPWGLNYDRDHRLRLIEDYWADDWETVEEDFREMQALGANVVRIHLQFGRFMKSPTEVDTDNLQRLERLVRLAESLGIYLDITGLGSYRKGDVPAWYDKLEEQPRWKAQANFWSAIAAALVDRPGVFCYDLINEPVVPGKKVDAWLHPFALAGFHYIQHVVLDPGDRDPDDIARQWTLQMTDAIRQHDRNRLITIGMLPIKPADAERSRGFVPAALKDDLNFLSIHLYPQRKKVTEAIATLELFDVGKPLLIEETFPLMIAPRELEDFIKQSRSIADGWLGFYWGKSVQEMDDDPGPLDKTMREWLELFKRLGPSNPLAPKSASQ